MSGTDNSTPVTLNTTSHDYLTLSSQQITLGPIVLTTDVTGALPVANGGTGATSASAARSALGVDAAGTDNSTDVTLATVTGNYLSISGQEITAGTVPVTLGGTGSTTASAARTALGVDAAGTDNSTNVTLASVSSNYLTISNQEITAGTVPVALGGTGSTTASSARSALGLGTAATTASTAYATAAQGTTADSALQDVVSDTTPQLGGNLDVNGNSIVSVSAGNISITPDTTGKIILDGLSWPTTDGSADQVLKTDGAGNLSFVNQSGGGGSGSSYIEHSSTVSDSLAISAGTNRMYIGNTSFSSGGVTMAGYLVISHGFANFTSASALNITGTLNVG